MGLFLIFLWLIAACALSADKGAGAFFGALIVTPIIGIFAYAALKGLGKLVGFELP